MLADLRPGVARARMGGGEKAIFYFLRPLTSSIYISFYTNSSQNTQRGLFMSIGCQGQPKIQTQTGSGTCVHRVQAAHYIELYI